MTGFSALQSILARWPDESIPEQSWDDNSLDRLRRVLLQFRSDPAAVGQGDLAGLIRHVLRRQTIIHSDARPAELRVPQSDGWPTESLWKKSAVDVIPQGPESFLIRAPRPWSAEWLSGSDKISPLTAAFAEEPRRTAWPEPGLQPLDPVLEEELGLTFGHYSCPGQRQAIHAAFFLKPGGTLVVNLPTGSGKSLVAWAPALLAPPGSLTVMVTPTIALAIDQERQLRDQYGRRNTINLPESMAWHSGLSPDARTQIRRHLADGSQRILIASPESIVTSLARPLYESAEAGRLKYFVVDEAHLVAQWGTEFRPEFQSMCGLRRELLKRCPTAADRFRTLLLSATLSQESFDILKELFAEQLFDNVSAVTLRPEPEYWMSPAHDELVRTDRVVELIQVVPRPFLLYVTTREQAGYWTDRMQQLGIKRSGCVHGATPSDIRSDIIDRWRCGELDAIVATSAFGLGMDKSDVRAVIHACVPETVDRFYQEVGRGGRDGRACVSILVHTDKDRDIARSLSSTKVITVDKGRERWRCMVDHARRDGARGRLALNLSQRPPGVRGDTDENNKWNLRTVVLLNRAGLIALESDGPPNVERVPTEDDDQYLSRREQVMSEYAVTCPVRILEEFHLDREVWNTRIEPIRRQMLELGRENIAVMDDVLLGHRELSEVLSAAYRLRADGLHVDPVQVCGGCSVCRSSGLERHSFSFPDPDAIRYVNYGTNSSLRRILGTEQSLVLVACPRSESLRTFHKKLFQHVLPKLVQLGIREIAAPPSVQDEKSCRDLYRQSPEHFLIHRELCDTDDLRTDIFVPRVSLFLTDSTDPIPDWLINLTRPLHIIFAWDDLRDRTRLDSLYFDRAANSHFNEILGRLHQ